MTQETISNLKVSDAYTNIAEQAQRAREDLLTVRDARSADVPLKFWRQHAHFTTPASGTPHKAIRGLASTAKILKRFGISGQEVAATSGAPIEFIEEALSGANPHSPFVMVDVEDAVALTEESLAKARLGAVRCFTEEDWGPTLPFYRPAGLRLQTCVDDLLTVLPEVANGRSAEEYPIAGIVWPKSEHPEEIAWVCELLGKIEASLGLETNQIKFEFLVESGYALAQLPELVRACAPRLVGIIWGIADYSADTNLPRIQNDHPVSDWAKYEIVNVAGSAGVPAIDCMTLNYPTPVHRGADLSEAQQRENKTKILGALKEVYDDALHGIELGMSGKWVGHPLQLLMVMAAYRTAISTEQIAKDLKEIEAYSESVTAGAGATMLGAGHDAYMADRATDRHLRARLRRATAWGTLAPEKAHELGIVTADEYRQLGG